jgi:hypothetical protein
MKLVVGLRWAIVVCLFAAAAAQDGATTEAVTADFKAKAGALIAVKDYPGALALYAQLENGKYPLGSPAVQAQVARERSVAMNKAKILVRSNRPEGRPNLLPRL